ncbi:MAG: NGG1p interacting factor NIF3 [Candidatus Aminicenantes bacterium]|nr:NGG1p interacting factor NIF3 [Candidatus Aminicenantes bacterium]
MKLGEIYRRAVAIGIEKDLRGREEIDRLLAEEKERYEKLEEDEKKTFDQDRLFNPFADTRILYGDPETEVKKALIGIDMEVGEVLLAYLLNRDREEKIDCLIAHHPEGRALARLAEVMKLQIDLLSQYGIAVSVVEQLMEKRIAEVERRLLPINHNRTVDVARLFGLPFLCLHTPADNCVTFYLKRKFEEEKPLFLKDLIKILKQIPEYRAASNLEGAPKILHGSENNRCGQIYVDMTGGTEGSKEIFDKIAASGISTLVGMHFSEEHLEKAKKANLNVVVAGHIASDTLGLNLLLDAIDPAGELEFICVSGFERRRRISEGNK